LLDSIRRQVWYGGEDVFTFPVKDLQHPGMDTLLLGGGGDDEPAALFVVWPQGDLARPCFVRLFPFLLTPFEIFIDAVLEFPLQIGGSLPVEIDNVLDSDDSTMKLIG